MKRLLLLLSIVTSLIVFTACPLVHYGYDYPNGEFPENPVNMTEFNSEFDDINMASPELNHTQALIFSSNRNSQGEQFDLLLEPLNFTWDKTAGTLKLTNNYGWTEMNSSAIQQLLDTINTIGNEYGPYSYITSSSEQLEFFTFYSSDEKGTNDIRLAYLAGEQDFLFGQNSQTFDSLFLMDIPFLIDSEFNECYLSLKTTNNAITSPYGVSNQYQFSQLYFCTDESGNYDIQYIDIPDNKTVVEFITDKNMKTKLSADILNSDYNERCPFVLDNTIIFSSDRPGGYGGYDFYYSTFDGQEWDTPKNMGEKINSDKDEYRAILINTYDFSNQLLIFSSNRDGGKGGFDLYYTGF